MKSTFSITHILHHNTSNFCILVIFHTFFTLISLNQPQIESENEEYPYIWFSMGIDHSNPYIHSTTILCDTWMGTLSNGCTSIATCIIHVQVFEHVCM